jgi:hypothetical protein
MIYLSSVCVRALQHTEECVIFPSPSATNDVEIFAFCISNASERPFSIIAFKKSESQSPRCCCSTFRGVGTIIICFWRRSRSRTRLEFGLFFFPYFLQQFVATLLFLFCGMFEKQPSSGTKAVTDFIFGSRIIRLSPKKACLIFSFDETGSGRLHESDNLAQHLGPSLLRNMPSAVGGTKIGIVRAQGTRTTYSLLFYGVSH